MVDIVHAFSKGIRHNRVDYQQIADFGHIGKISEIVDRLENLGGTEEATLSELSLDSNPRDWITALLANYSRCVDEQMMRYLLWDFTDKMKTRMREETKYVIGLLFSRRLVLCHSLYSGETITPTWDIIPRMLDTDNVLRYVSFIAEDKLIRVRFWERYSTSSFVDWLGLKRKKGFLFGGPYRVRSEIDGMSVEFQLDDKQIEDFVAGHPEFARGQIRLSSPVSQLTVDAIEVGGKPFRNSEDFLQIYQAERYGVLPYVEKYKQLNKTISPILYKYVDEEKQVVRVSGGELSVEVTKDLPLVEIVFVNQFIDISESYVKKLASRFSNNEAIRIFHAGCEFVDPPICIGNTQLFNRLTVDEIARALVDFYEGVNLSDRELDLIVRYLIIERLQQANAHLPMTHFLKRFALAVLDLIEVQSRRWVKLEGNIIEYKASDYLGGSNNEVIRRLTDDVKSKLKDSPVKLYVFGVEDDGELKPISKSRISSDRLNTLCNGVQGELKHGDYSQLEVAGCQIPAAKGCLVLMVFRR